MTTLFAAIEGGCPDQVANFATWSGVSREAGDTRSAPKGYRLPHDVADRLRGALVGYKNGDAAMALAIFVARFWSSRSRLARPFPIDRRALADRDDLGLTEARIRGAIRVLEEIGFLNRGAPAIGSVHKMTEAGELHRKPILFGFGADFGPLFALANARAERARLRREGRAVQGNPVVGATRTPTAARTAVPMVPTLRLHSPKDKASLEEVVLMGDVANGSSREPSFGRKPPSEVEEALERLRAVWRSRNPKGGAHVG